jgi:hypothetical protein
MELRQFCLSRPQADQNDRDHVVCAALPDDETRPPRRSKTPSKLKNGCLNRLALPAPIAFPDTEVFLSPDDAGAEFMRAAAKASVCDSTTIKQAFACQYRLRCRCHGSHPCKLSPLNRFAPPAHSARTKRSLRIVVRNDTQFRKQPKYSDGANASCNAKCLPKIRRRIPQAGQADRRDYYTAVATVVEGAQ